MKAKIALDDAQVVAIAKTRMESRFVHLPSHLKTPNILTPDQIKSYNIQRGYDNPDPCATMPKGH